MATYTVSGGVLICIGAGITSADIYSNLISLSLGSGHFQETNGNKNTYFFNARIQIGDSSNRGAASVWDASNEIIKINGTDFVIYGKYIQGNLLNNRAENGGSLAVNTTGGNDKFFMEDQSILNVYGGAFYASNRIRVGSNVQFKVEYADFEPEDGVSLNDSVYNSSNSEISYRFSRVHNTQAVAIKAYANSTGNTFDLTGTRVENAAIAFQLRSKYFVIPIIFDTQADTCVLHTRSFSSDQCEIVFINPDFTTLRTQVASQTDISSIGFRYSSVVVDFNLTPIANIVCRYVDGNNDVIINNELTDASGTITSFLPVYDGVRVLLNSTYVNTAKTDRKNFTKSFIGYNFLISSSALVIDRDLEDTIPLLSDRLITEATKTTVDAYTEIGTGTKFYDRSKSFLVDNYLGESTTIVILSGTSIDAGSYNVTIDATAASVYAFDGTTITIKASTYTGDITTTGVINLLNNVTYIGTRTDANGTISPPTFYTLQFPNIIDDSRFQVYNLNSGIELHNTIVSGGSGINVIYEKQTDYSAGDVGRYRITYQNGVNAKEPVEGIFVFPTDTTINSIPTVLQPSEVYTVFGLDGSTISEFSWDSGNIEVDINDLNNSTSVQRFAAWYCYFITTAIGINDAFGGISWESLNSIKINSNIVDVTLDNTKTNPLMLTGGRLYRSDLLTVISANSNSIQIDYNPVYTIETGVSGLTSSESTQLDSLSDILEDTNVTIPNQISGLNNFNPTTDTVINVESVTTNLDMRGTDDALLDTNYVEPDNTSINLILADTNELQLNQVTIDLSPVQLVVDAILVDTNDLQTNQGQWLTATDFVTNSTISTIYNNLLSEHQITQTAINEVDLTPVTNAITNLNNFNPATDVVTRVTLVDTTSVNTDMRGTDDANVVAPDNTSILAILQNTNALSVVLDTEFLESILGLGIQAPPPAYSQNYAVLADGSVVTEAPNPENANTYMENEMKNYTYNDVSGLHWPDANAGDDLYYALNLNCLNVLEGENVTSVDWIIPNEITTSDSYLNSDSTEAHVKLATLKAGVYRIWAEVNSDDTGKISKNRIRIMLKVI